MTLRLAYLDRAGIHVVEGGIARAWDSPFAEGMRRRRHQIAERKAWKTQGTSGRMLWGAGEAEAAHVLPIETGGLAPGRTPGELLYVVRSPEVSGICARPADGSEEVRVFHTAEARIADLTGAPDVDLVACSVTLPTGAANLAVLAREGRHLREITEGDSIDLAPSWIPGAGKRIVYQTAGVARTAQGVPAGRGPFAIGEVDLVTGSLSIRAEDPAHDLVLPKVGGDGALYYVRRPYEEPRERASFLDSVVDALLVPWRVLQVVFGWLNFLSFRYTGKPLARAGGTPQTPGLSPEHLFLLGVRVDAKVAAEEAARAGEQNPGIVPQSWELVKRDAKETRLMGGVVGYDLLADGTLIATNGTAVYRLAADGRRDLVCTGNRIEGVVALEAPRP